MTAEHEAGDLLPNGRLRPAGLDEALIADVVAAFYREARADPLLGPVFDAAIEPAEWPAHLATIADFWSSVLLGTARYAGRPMPKHLALPGLGDAHFARWLALFRATAERLCPAPVAALFVDRAERIANSFRLGLAFHRGDDTSRLAPMRAGALTPG